MPDHRRGYQPAQTLQEIRTVDWPDRQVTAQAFTQVAFLETDLSETVTERSTFDQCHFRGVRFNVSVHRSSAFVNCTFTRCTFFGATFEGCKLVGSTFERCTLDRLTILGGDWSFVVMANAKLTGVHISGTRMREADLSGTRIDGSVRDVDLSGAWLDKADLSHSDLRGSDLSTLDPTALTLTDAVITYQQAIALAQGLGFDVRPD